MRSTCCDDDGGQLGMSGGGGALGFLRQHRQRRLQSVREVAGLGAARARPSARAASSSALRSSTSGCTSAGSRPRARRSRPSRTRDEPRAQLVDRRHAAPHLRAGRQPAARARAPPRRCAVCGRGVHEHRRLRDCRSVTCHATIAEAEEPDRPQRRAEQQARRAATAAVLTGSAAAHAIAEAAHGLDERRRRASAAAAR